MQKIIFFNTGWMKDYKGLNSSDKIKGGGRSVDDGGFGHEIMNFAPHKGQMYGYVESRNGAINLERLFVGAGNKVEHVLVIWIASSPGKGSVIVGWYKDATVYRNHKSAPIGSRRVYKGEKLGYYVKAKQSNCKLLPIDERVFKILRQKKGWLGQSNVWYADTESSNILKFKQEVIEYVLKGKNIRQVPEVKKKNFVYRQIDPVKRKKIETNAVRIVTNYYKRLGYVVSSVEKDNVGWDLEAYFGESETLYLEVKGLSGREVCIELTPNEYSKVLDKNLRNKYRICVVVNAENLKSKPHIFYWSPEVKNWSDDNGNILLIKERLGANMFLK
jgi:hypothetical protein